MLLSAAAPRNDRKCPSSVRFCFDHLNTILRRQQTIWISVATGTDPCNHRYTVTIDTKSLFHVTHYSPFAGIHAGHNYLSKPSSIILLQSILHFTAESVSVLYLNLKREPSRVKSLRLVFPVVGWRSRKKAWLSTAHFHSCLQILELASWNTKVCSCSRPCTVRKTTKQLACVCDCAWLYAGVCLWQDTNLIIILHHDQCESALFKVQPSDFGPK